MGIDVEHRHTAEPPAQALDRDRRVVDVAEPRSAVGAGMMPRGAAERIDEWLARHQRVGGRDGGVAGAQHRTPGLGPDRHRQVAEVPSRLPDQPFGRTGKTRRLLGPPAPVGEGVRPHFRPRVRQPRPSLPGGLEEAQVGCGVDGERRAGAVLGRSFRRDTAGAQDSEEPFGAHRQVLDRHDAAEPHVLLRIVKRLVR